MHIVYSGLNSEKFGLWGVKVSKQSNISLSKCEKVFKTVTTGHLSAKFDVTRSPTLGTEATNCPRKNGQR